MATSFFEPAVVLPHLQGWAATRAFLCSLPVPQPSGFGRVLQYETLRFPLRWEHLQELSECGRGDLAVLLLETVAPVELLREVAGRAAPDEYLVGVCRNVRVPVPTVLRAYGCIRSEVLREQVSRPVAERLAPGTAIALLQRFVGIAAELRCCPAADLVSVVERAFEGVPVLRNWRHSRVLLAVLDREGRLPASAWRFLVDFACTAEGAVDEEFIVALAERPEASVADLLGLLRVSVTSAAAAAALAALVRRDVVPDPVQYSAVYQASDWAWCELLADAVGSPQAAVGLAELGPVFSSAAVKSGYLPVAAAQQWAAHTDEGSVGLTGRAWSESGLDSVSAVPSAEWLVRVVEEALQSRDTAPLAFAARNPALPVDVQLTLAAASDLRLATWLAQNPSLDPRVAEVLAFECVRDRVECWGELLKNPAVSWDVRRALPASIALQMLEQGVWSTEAGLIALLEVELGDDVRRWREFEALLPEWHGSVGDLANVLRVLS